MKVSISSKAENDLKGIARFIASDNSPRAISFVAELKTVALRLSDQPRGYPLVPSHEGKGIRRRSWRGYGILYAVSEDSIVVLRILGPGQDHDRILQLK